MIDFERKVLASAVSFKPRLWKRCGGDVFSIIKKRQTEQLLDHINNIDGNIRFTLEREHGGQLLFLDVKVIRERDQLKTAVFRKANNTGQVLNFVSHHAPSAKSAVARALMDRVDSHIRAYDLEDK